MHILAGVLRLSLALYPQLSLHATTPRMHIFLFGDIASAHGCNDDIPSSHSLVIFPPHTVSPETTVAASAVEAAFVGWPPPVAAVLCSTELKLPCRLAHASLAGERIGEAVG